MSTVFTRRALLALCGGCATGFAGPMVLAQDSHGSGGSGAAGGGHGGGGPGAGGGHMPGGDDSTEHSHDEGEHTDDSHEHTEHDPDSGHDDGKRGPRYRGGRGATGPIGRGRGRSLEDRVLKDH